MRLRHGLWLCWALALPTATWAHHSVVATYDTKKSISISGNVQSLQLANPHSYLVVEVPEPGGKPTRMRGEMTAVGLLRRAGWTEHSLAIGEHVQLTGSPARYSATDFYVTSVTKANGSHLALLPGGQPDAGSAQK
jgi:hypothetical protein